MNPRLLLDLEYKADASAACDRMAAWWEGEILDRPTIQVSAPLPRRKTKPARHHASLRERWMDVEYVVECAEAHIASTYWAGELLPQFVPNLGPDLLAGAVGAELLFGEHTSWSLPLLSDWSSLDSVSFQRDNIYVETILKVASSSSDTQICIPARILPLRCVTRSSCAWIWFWSRNKYIVLCRDWSCHSLRCMNYSGN
jgi:hypothetical protein